MSLKTESTIQEIKRLPIQHPLPDLTEIARAMAGRFGAVSPLLQHVITPCAEVAERILLHLTGPRGREEYSSKTIIKPTENNNRQGQFLRSGYHCDACGFAKISINHSFCAGCGRRIIWQYPWHKKQSAN